MNITPGSPQELAKEYYREPDQACPFCNKKSLWRWTEGYEYGMVHDKDG